MAIMIKFLKSIQDNILDKNHGYHNFENTNEINEAKKLVDNILLNGDKSDCELKFFK